MGNVVPFGQGYRGRVWQFNEREDDALQYLPHADQVLYLRGFRANMDFDTGRVGERQRVSYRYFRELLEVQRQRGSTAPEVCPTREFVRASIGRLVRAGLVARVENPGHQVGDCMVFLLPLAHVGFIRSNEEPHRNNTGTTTQENPVTARVGSDMSHTSKNDMSHRNQYTSIHNSTSVECENSGECSALPSEPRRFDNCPHQQILALWQKHWPGKSQPNLSQWSGSNGAALLRARWRQAAETRHSKTGERLYVDLETGLDWWDKFLGYLAQSDFLRGANWFEFRWLIKPENFLKALEGKYND